MECDCIEWVRFTRDQPNCDIGEFMYCPFCGDELAPAEDGQPCKFCGAAAGHHSAECVDTKGRGCQP